jgi:hypothetical protein
MHRFTVRALILSFCLLSLCAMAQENRVIRVGVAVMRSQAASSLSGNWAQDRLVADLNQQKPDKKQHIKLQGIPLEGTSPDEVGNEANQKNCDYVVYTNLLELRQASSDNPMQQQQSPPGGMQPYPGGTLGLPPTPSNTNPPGMSQAYRATVEYRLYRTGDSAAVSSTSLSGQQSGPAEAAVSQVLNQVASRVLADVKKAPPARQE